jgi:hypothetical protein
LSGVPPLTSRESDSVSLPTRCAFTTRSVFWTRYLQGRYPRCAFVYTFSGQWLHDERCLRSAEEWEAARAELTLNASARIGASDRILNGPI